MRRPPRHLHPIATLLAVAIATLGLASHAQVPLPLDALEAAARARSLELGAAQADLVAADRDLDRAERDPLATGLDRLQARHAVAAAEAGVRAAELALHATSSQRLVAVLEAEAALRQARLAAEIATRQLAADQVRADAGLITPLDLDRAASDVERAVRSAAEAEQELEQRWSELSLHTGLARSALAQQGVAAIAAEPPALPPIADLLQRAGLDGVPTPSTAQGDVNVHAAVAAAQRALEVARVQLAGSDHEAAAPNAVAAARDAVAAGERRLDDARANAELQLRGAHQAHGAALGRLDDARRADLDAAATLAAQRVRADAGELAPLALLRAELERARASDALDAARHAAWSTWWRLEQALVGP